MSHLDKEYLQFFHLPIAQQFLQLHFLFSLETMDTAVSIKSLTMDSTSLPTYPTSVNLLASTLINGAFASDASLRAISVFPIYS